MSGKGGYQPPAHPAPVSGPGALSQRTDGGAGQPIRDWPDAGYGENKSYRAQQAGAPLAQSPGLPPVIPLDAPSQRPGEPVTAGAPLGPGPGPEALGPMAPPATGQLSQLLFGLAAGDMTGALAQLADEALNRGL